MREGKWKSLFACTLAPHLDTVRRISIVKKQLDEGKVVLPFDGHSSIGSITPGWQPYALRIEKFEWSCVTLVTPRLGVNAISVKHMLANSQ